MSLHQINALLTQKRSPSFSLSSPSERANRQRLAPRARRRVGGHKTDSCSVLSAPTVTLCAHVICFVCVCVCAYALVSRASAQD